MGKKVMIIVWKWNLRWEIEKTKNGEIPVRQTEDRMCDFIGKNHMFSINVGGDDSNEFFGFTRQNQYHDGDEFITPNYSDSNINEICKKKLDDGYEVLLLLHGGNPDNYNQNSDLYLKYKYSEKKIFVELFLAGEGSIYENILAGGNSYFRDDAMENIKDKDDILIKEEKFLNTWNYYCCDLPHKKKKNEILSLILPLSIDIQGLKEIIEKNKEKFNKYLDDIRKSDYKIDMKDQLKEKFGDINKIVTSDKQILKNDYRVICEILKEFNSETESSGFNKSILENAQKELKELFYKLKIITN